MEVVYIQKEMIYYQFLLLLDVCMFGNVSKRNIYIVFEIGQVPLTSPLSLP